MEHVEHFRSEILKKLNIVETFVELKPVTVKGKMFQQKALASLKDGQMTVAKINGYLTEMSKLKNDIEVYATFKEMNNIVAESRNRYMLVLAYESIVNRKLSKDINTVIAKKINETLAKTDKEIYENMQCGEIDMLAKHHGAIAMIVHEAKDALISEKGNFTNEHINIYSPISYVTEKNGELYARIENCVFKINENGIHEAECPSQKFALITNIMENSVDQDVTNNDIIISTVIGDVKINENGISLVKDEKEVSMNENQIVDEFTKRYKLKQISEQQASIADSIVAISCNYDDITALNNIKVIHNSQFNESVMFGVQNEKSYYAVLKSSRRIKAFESFDNVISGIDRVKQATGVNLTSFFKKELANESLIVAESYKERESLKAEMSEYKSRMDVISEQFKSVEDGSDSHNKLLEAYELTKLKYNEVKSIYEGSERVAPEKGLTMKVEDFKSKVSQISETLKNEFISASLIKDRTKRSLALRQLGQKADMVGYHNQILESLSEK